MILQVMLFELVLPPVSPPEPFELWVLFLPKFVTVWDSDANLGYNRDLVIIQEMPNELIPNITDTANKICRPLIKSKQLDPSNLRIKLIEFECFDEKESRQRFFGPTSFDGMRDWRAVDYPWLSRPAAGVITASLRMGIEACRDSATKVIVLNVRSIPIRSGKPLGRRNIYIDLNMIAQDDRNFANYCGSWQKAVLFWYSISRRNTCYITYIFLRFSLWVSPICLTHL